MNHFAERQRRLLQKLKKQQVDVLLVTNPVNVTYLTGFSGDSSYLFVGAKKTILVSDFRFTQQLAEECPDLETYIRPHNQTLLQATAATLKKLKCQTVGFESDHLTVADFESLREQAPPVDWKGCPGLVRDLRTIKDADEIRQIRQAVHVAERAFRMFHAMVRLGDSEKELCDALETYIRRAGGRCSSFPIIVAAGHRAALAHAPPTGQRLEEAGLLLVDWGADVGMYKSDLTRVFAVHKISPKLRDVHRVVVEAQHRAIRSIRAGVRARDVDAEARSYIADQGFGKFFGHGLGHGIGLEIHEAPSIRQNSDDILQPGMVITIEPGIYLPGWGGVRIEDDVLVTKDGCEILTQVNKELEILC
ncbi:MAG: peptidase M24 [Gemmatales bacterium]|nr:MAG: peptidase M24 [Gemmatales bacterium]